MTHHRKVDDDLKVWPETVAAAIAAVATVPGLKTLGVHAQYGLWAPEDLLLPLTAAGSSLEKLDLSGCLYKSMPPAATGASERMQWTGKREDEPPALATLVQRVRDLQTGPDSLPDVIITSLVQNSWSSHQHRNRSRRVLLEPLIHDLTQVMKAILMCLTTPCSSNSSSTVSNSNTPQQQPESSSDLELSAATPSTQMLATAATCVGSGWHYRLQRFTGLRELHINTTRCGYLDIFVECLPASLRVLSGGRLRITSFTDVIAAAASTDSTMPSCSKSTEPPTRSQLQLEELRLSTSLLSSPSILASSRLYRLSIAGVLWSGGWAAAAAAWPNVRQLVWRYDKHGVDSSQNVVTCFTKMVLYDHSSTRAVGDILANFRRVKSLTVLGLPWLRHRDKQHAQRQLQRQRHISLWQHDGRNMLIKCGPYDLFGCWLLAGERASITVV